MMALEHAGLFLHLAPAGLVADVVTRAIAHRHERRHRQADLATVELYAIAADVSGHFQPFDALHNRRPRQADFIRDRLVARAAVLAKNAENSSAGRVEISLCGDLGASPRGCPTIRVRPALSVDAACD